MQDNGNKAIVIVFAVLISGILVLAIGAMSGNGGGSSSGGAVPRVPAQEGQEEQLGTAEQQAETGQQESAQQVETQPVDSPSSDPLDDEITREQLEAELSTSTAPVGQNARDAYTSTNVPMANAVYSAVKQRGFDDVDVEADFSIDGTYSDPHVLDPSSDQAYPSYTFEYVSATGVLWIVMVNDGSYYAVPMGSEQGAVTKQIIISETDSITQYDGIKNEYSDFSLDELQGVIGVRVDAIDTFTLDAYTLDQLNAM